jgi:hypothetical protein
MLQLTRTGSVPIRIGFVSASVIRCANAAAWWWSTPDLMTANSSPPTLATTSWSSEHSRSRRPMVSSVSRRVAVEIVDGLESVEIDVQKGERVSVPLQIVEARLDAGPEVAPVG